MKKTDIEKVTGKRPSTIIIVMNRLSHAPFKEMLVVRKYY